MRVIYIVLAFALAITSRASLAQKSGVSEESDWKRIAVLRFTRPDVERLLGKSEDQGHGVYYPLKEGSLYIEYSEGFCQPEQYAGWNVPEWTVVEVTYNPFKNPPRLSSMNLNLATFRQVRESPDVPDLITYIKDDEGVAYTFEPDGELHDIRYFPSSHYNNLRCSEILEKASTQRAWHYLGNNAQ